MILNTSLMYQGGILLSKGATVTERHLKQMKTWGVDIFETQDSFSDFSQVVQQAGTSAVASAFPPAAAAPVAAAYRPKGYEIDSGATFIIDDSIDYTEGPILMDQNLVIQGTIHEDVQLETSGDIQIIGEVHPGSKIFTKGNLTVRGTIMGEKDRPAIIRAKNIKGVVAERSLLTSQFNVEMMSLRNCTTRAGGEVEVSDQTIGILGGETEAGISIRAGSAKGTTEGPAILKVLLLRQKQLFQAITRIEKSTLEKEEEYQKLSKVIDVIRLLGDKIVTLPPEKKQELALQSKRFMELKTEIAELQKMRERIQDEMEGDVISIDSCPVQINEIYPGVEIGLGASILRLNSRQSRTGYYQKAGRILAVTERL